MRTNLLARELASDPYNLRERLVVRMRAASWDRQLAAGREPVPGTALAAYARHLTSPAAREELARRWRKVLRLGSQPGVPLMPHAPLRRREVAAAEADVRELIASLAGSRPIAARGAATASWLLTDGTGPLYNGRSPAGLRSAVRTAIRHLEPTASTAADLV